MRFSWGKIRKGTQRAWPGMQISVSQPDVKTRKWTEINASLSWLLVTSQGMFKPKQCLTSGACRLFRMRYEYQFGHIFIYYFRHKNIWKLSVLKSQSSTSWHENVHNHPDSARGKWHANFCSMIGVWQKTQVCQFLVWRPTWRLLRTCHVHVPLRFWPLCDDF